MTYVKKKKCVDEDSDTEEDTPARAKLKSKKMATQLQWAKTGEDMVHRGKKWEAGSLVYLKWAEDLEPVMRVVIAVGTCRPRNCFVAALWRSCDPVCEKDNEYPVLVCQLTYLVVLTCDI